MKFGPRKPNFKKRIKARTTGKMKRKVKKSVNPLYGKKGMGWVKNPKKAAYNKIYKKTTFDAVPSFSGKRSHSTNSSSSIACFAITLLIISLLFPPLLIISIPIVVYTIIKQKKVKVKNEYNRTIIDKLSEVDDLIKENQKIKTLEPFFERIDKIFSLKEEVFKSLNTGLEKQYIEKDALTDVKQEITEIINNLLKNYIKRYEKSSFDDAMSLKTGKGQHNNYRRSYDDLQKYNEYFTPELKRYIEERWKNIK